MVRKLLILMLMLLATAAFSDNVLDRIMNCLNPEEAQVLVASIDVSNPESDLYLGIIYHNIAITDTEQYVEKAEFHLGKYLKLKESSIALGYLGSVITIKASVSEAAGNFLQALTLLEEGSKMIDQAVEDSPDIINLRILRITNGYDVTRASPVERTDVLLIDLDFLKTQYDSLDQEIKCFYHLYLGRIFLDDNRIIEGITELERAVRCAPASEYGKNAYNLLLEWEE